MYFRSGKQYYALSKEGNKASLDDINYNPKRARDLKGGKDVKAKAVPYEPVDNEWSPAPYSAFKLILSARFAAALWTSISDCDETYNYWEPVSIEFNRHSSLAAVYIF